MNYWHLWNHFWYTVWANRRIEDLCRLVDWAKRKHLHGVSQAYRGKLAKELISLKASYHHDPQMVIWARRVYKFLQLFHTEPRSYRKGSAKYYRN